VNATGRNLTRSFGIATLLSISFAVACARMPSDESLIERFKQDRSSFERLAALALAEAEDTTFVMIRSSDPSNAKRHADALAIMKRLRINNIFAQKVGVLFEATGFSHMQRGYYKGWEYVPGGQLPDSVRVLSSLDRLDRLPPYERRYRSLGDGWYLYIGSLDTHTRRIPH